MHFLNTFRHGNKEFQKGSSQYEIVPLLVVFHLPYSEYKGVEICFYSCRYQNQNFSLVLRSCRSCSTRVALLLRSYRSRLTRVTLVLHSYCPCLTCITLVLHSCCSCLVLVLQIRLDLHLKALKQPSQKFQPKVLTPYLFLL